MHFYNAIQAARYIGVDPKTVRRWLKKGLLTAERTEQGWLAIPGGQVEYAKIKWEEEQAKFARPWLSKDALGGQAREDMNIIGRVEVLEQKVAELEKAMSNTSLGVPMQPIPQKRNVATSSPLPDDWVLCSDFFEGLGLKETTFRRWLKDGLQGEQFEFEKRDKYRYMTPEQQEKAVSLLRKHGKLQ